MQTQCTTKHQIILNRKKPRLERGAEIKNLSKNTGKFKIDSNKSWPEAAESSLKIKLKTIHLHSCVSLRTQLFFILFIYWSSLVLCNKLLIKTKSNDSESSPETVLIIRRYQVGGFSAHGHGHGIFLLATYPEGKWTNNPTLNLKMSVCPRDLLSWPSSEPQIKLSDTSI